MKFMVIVKATPESEAGKMPSEDLLTRMGAYNQQLVAAGVMLAGEGLHPSAKGVRVRFSGAERIVIPGPFPANGDLVSGFWLWNVSSREEAIEWLKRAPFDDGAELEVRQVFAPEDFGPELTPELREQEEQLRARTARNA